MLMLSYEGTPSSGSEAPSIDGRVVVFECEEGHLVVRISAPTDPDQPSPTWEMNILAGEVDQCAAANKWFGMSCTHVQKHEACRWLRSAVALEALSNTVKQINEVVGRVWERSIGEIQAEAITDTGTGGSAAREAKQNENGDCETCSYGLSRCRQHPQYHPAS